MVTTISNADLQFRRLQLRPRRSQSDMRRALKELTGVLVSVSRISDFELGSDDEIANGVTRKHYEKVLARWERESRRTLGGSGK